MESEVSNTEGAFVVKPAPIRVVIADDQKLIRDALRIILKTDERLAVVGVAESGHDAAVLAELETADIVLMDLRMETSSGLQGTVAVRNLVPQCKVLILTAYPDDSEVLDAVRAGAHGAILKDCTVEELISSIERVMSGEVVLSPDIMQALVSWFRVQTSGPPQTLSSREIEVIEGVVSGMTNREIAGTLYITESSVKSHLNRIFAKLQIRRRTDLVSWASEHGLIRGPHSPR